MPNLLVSATNLHAALLSREFSERLDPALRAIVQRKGFRVGLARRRGQLGCAHRPRRGPSPRRLAGDDQARLRAR
ncbi:MAG: hypothetical protein ACR2KT_10215 [Methylocella sp.]